MATTCYDPSLKGMTQRFSVASTMQEALIDYYDNNTPMPTYEDFVKQDSIWECHPFYKDWLERMIAVEGQAYILDREPLVSTDVFATLTPEEEELLVHVPNYRVIPPGMWLAYSFDDGFLDMHPAKDKVRSYAQLTNSNWVRNICCKSPVRLCFFATNETEVTDDLRAQAKQYLQDNHFILRRL